tara:strand:+ start:93 stop:470 length:378 start_codon:yes stop_codon:yes gene_type:complete
MANPSTVNTTASGKEVVRRSYIDGAGETEATILTGVANHIMTIVSIIICDRSNQSDALFSMYVDFDLGGTDLYLLEDQSCGSKSTFVFNDRFAITATDKLHIIGSSSAGTAQYDVWCTYIDQDWS